MKNQTEIKKAFIDFLVISGAIIGLLLLYAYYPIIYLLHEIKVKVNP